MRSFLIALSVISIFILAYWVKNLRRENIRLESRVGQMESQVTNTGQLQAQINYERQRLQGLRASLAEVMRLGAQPPTGSYDAHISSLTSRISTLETQLRNLAQESRAVESNAQAFQQGVQAAIQAQPQAQDLNQQASVQAQGEQNQITDERSILQSELLDLRADLNFWRSLRDAPAEQPARIRQLELQISAGEARLNELDAQIQAR